MSVQPQASRSRRSTDGPDAFDALFGEHRTVAYSLALCLLGDEGAAEEVTRDAFLMVWRGVDGRRTRRDEILGVVRGQVLAHLRGAAGDSRDDAATIVRLAHHGGLGYGEIAAELDLPPAHVARQMRVGLTLLSEPPPVTREG